MNKSTPARGRFITFEGGEGVGKSSQIERLASALRHAGMDVVQTREPGGTPQGEELRKILLQGDADKWDAVSETLILNAARRAHVENIIKPALAAGKWVLCDRFIDSTMAYQGFVKSVGRDVVEKIQQLVLGDFKPDLTFILDLPTSITLDRVDKRKGKKDRIEMDYHKMHTVLRGAFLDIAGREPDRCLVIDGTGGFDAVTDRLLGAINARFHTNLNLSHKKRA